MTAEQLKESQSGNQQSNCRRPGKRWLDDIKDGLRCMNVTRTSQEGMRGGDREEEKKKKKKVIG